MACNVCSILLFLLKEVVCICNVFTQEVIYQNQHFVYLNACTMTRMDRWIDDSLISKLAAKTCYQILRNAQIVSSHDPDIVLRVAHAIDSAQILPFARRRSTSWGLTTLRRVPRATTSARPTWPRSVWRIAMRRCATSSTLSRRASKTEWRLQSPQ